jgi:hypothetical protein
MMNSASTGVRGRFWLQGNPENEGVSGRLLLVSGIHSPLELDELLTPLPWPRRRNWLVSRSRSTARS